LQWLHDLNETDEDNLNNVRCETSRYFKNNNWEYLKNKINEHASNSKNKNIRDLHKGINEFKGDYQPRNNLVMDETVICLQIPTIF
jgi:hypothetical protein